MKLGTSIETPPAVAEVALPKKAAPETSLPGAGLRLAGAVTMGVGGALLIAGGALNLKYNSMIRDLRDEYRAPPTIPPRATRR